MSKASTCGLLGLSRQVYYRSLRSRKAKQDKASEVIRLVNNVRRDMPRIGFRKLYHILHTPLQEMKVGRDKFLSILKANHMLIKPQRSYRITRSVLLYRKSNTLTFTEQVKKDGSPILVDGEPQKVVSTPEDFKRLFLTITDCLTAEEKNRAKGDRMIVSLFISPNTGTVMEVNFSMYPSNNGFCTIPPERYYQIEQTLKQNIKYTVTDNGKKYNYILIWIPVKIFN